MTAHHLRQLFLFPDQVFVNGGVAVGDGDGTHRLFVKRRGLVRPADDGVGVAHLPHGVKTGQQQAGAHAALHRGGFGAMQKRTSHTTPSGV